MASSQHQPCEPRPAEGHVGNRALPPGGTRRPYRALRGLRPSGSPSARPSCSRCRTSTSCSRCRPGSAAIAYQNKAVVYDLLFKASPEAMLTIVADPEHPGGRRGLAG
jgi:hypothetical protein